MRAAILALAAALPGLAGCASAHAVTAVRPVPGWGACRGATDDTLRPVPPSLAPKVIASFRVTMTPAEVERNGVIRCAGGAVLACLAGANLNCGKADTRRHNPGAAYWCRTHPDARFVPLFAAGHASVFAWRCAGTEPVVARVVQQVDARGFSASHWRVIVPASAGRPAPG